MSAEEKVVKLLTEKQKIITFVESCSGGSLANAITNIPGSSKVLRGSFVTYSNEAKIALGVSTDVIEEHSVYSPQCAMSMASAGVARLPGTTLSIGVTGTLINIDPENVKYSVPNMVYIGALYYNEVNLEWEEFYFTMKLLNVPTRIKAKNLVQEAVMNIILKILGGHYKGWLFNELDPKTFKDISIRDTASEL